MTTLESLNGDLFQKMELYAINNTQNILGGTCKTWNNEVGTRPSDGCPTGWDKSYDGGSNITCVD